MLQRIKNECHLINAKAAHDSHIASALLEAIKDAQQWLVIGNEGYFIQRDLAERRSV